MTTELETPLLLNVPKTAQALGIGVAKVWQLLASGDIESVSIGSRRLIPREALAAYIDRLRQT